MDNEKKNVSLITGYLREFANIFTLLVLSISLTGIFISFFYPETQNLSAIFALGREGLPYTAIMQSVGFALIMAFVSRILFSGYFSNKLTFMWRYFLFFLATLITTSVFSIIFKWFPVNNLRAWLIFIPVFFIFFTAAIVFSLILLKIEDKKYNRLLENYKSRQSDEYKTPKF